MFTFANNRAEIKSKHKRISIVSFIVAVIILIAIISVYFMKVEIKTMTLSFTYLSALVLLINGRLYERKYGGHERNLSDFIILIIHIDDFFV